MQKGTSHKVYDEKGNVLGLVAASAIRPVASPVSKMKEQKARLHKRIMQMVNACDNSLYDHLDTLTGRLFEEIGVMQKIRRERKTNGGQ
jgi:hypothetical protein